MEINTLILYFSLTCQKREEENTLDDIVRKSYVKSLKLL